MTITEDNAADLAAAIISQYGEDELQMMIGIARRLGVLDAVVATNGTDIEACSQWLYQDKEGIVTLDEMRQIVTTYIPEIESEGLVVLGIPTDEAIQISEMHRVVLGACGLTQ